MAFSCWPFKVVQLVVQLVVNLNDGWSFKVVQLVVWNGGVHNGDDIGAIRGGQWSDKSSRNQRWIGTLVVL